MRSFYPLSKFLVIERQGYRSKDRVNFIRAVYKVDPLDQVEPEEGGRDFPFCY